MINNIIMDKVNEIIKAKKTKLCLALDVENKSDLFYFIEMLGDYICILKIHYDIIEMFNENTITFI